MIELLESESEVVQSCPTLSGPMDCSLPGSSVHAIFQAQLICRVHQQNAGLDEAQTRIKIARINNNNLRYADDTAPMEKSEEELNRLLMNMKEESEKAGLKLNLQKTKTMASSSITSWQIDGETMETVRDFTF